ncbi:MAG: GGDEF domain-containing protein [Actinomycetota bacterium]
MAAVRTAPQQPAPLSRDALFRTIGPLIGTAYLGLCSIVLPNATGDDGAMLLKAATLTTITVAAMLIVPWHRLPRAVQVAPALMYVLVALLIREGTGGATSIFAQLILVPILWLAVYGSLGEVVLGIGAIALAMVGSLLLTPDPKGAVTGTMLLVVVGAAVGVGVQRLFAFLRLHADQLDLMARTDPLTGASNRRAWQEELNEAMDEAEESHMPLCAALIDLDHFKEFNDERGHQAGDRLLKEVTARWRNQLREGDILARLGGDEFSILLKGCPLDAAQGIVRRLVEDLPYGASCSTGLAHWDGEEGGEGLLRRADEALYEAKGAGRNRISVAP